jgi:transaldolase
MQNPLKELSRFGQSVWLDYIHRNLFAEGKLASMIENDGLKGMTSNPSIFQKAIAESNNYDNDIEAMAKEGRDFQYIYEALSRSDIQTAADHFKGVYDATDRLDGYVSLEVNPHFACDTGKTVDEARRLWSLIERPNVFIKVPATVEGLSAIRQLISEGININVTLLFGLPRYHKVADAYLSGIDDRLRNGEPVDHVRSVASFFLSRIDSLLDPQLEDIAKNGGELAETASKAHGQVAIASAKVAYQIYKDIYASKRFQELKNKGAHPQRLLWASTSTKNPDYEDTKYVDALVGPETVNTMPMETIDAYRDHGDPKPRLEDDVDQADWILSELSGLGIDIDAATQKLEDEGIEKFNKPFDALMDTLKNSIEQKKNK